MPTTAPHAPFDTLVTMLRTRAASAPDLAILSFLDDEHEAVDRLTFAGLDERARAIAARLQVLGASGERALLLYAPGIDFVAAFFGCLYAGVVAVPAYPPRPRTLSRLQHMVEDAQPAVILSTSDVRELVVEMLAEEPGFPELPWEITDHVASSDLAAAWVAPELTADSLAFLQYTSGSTATPRGVMVSHGNLLHNSAMIQASFGSHSASVGVSWLPLYHDMGLIGGIIQPVYAGFPLTLMSPLTFLQRPFRWLEAISKTGASMSGGPNFAYDLAVRKITPEQRATLDLSRWEVAFSGAEPVRAATMERFNATFAECGFRPAAWYPCYGLAEATLFVTGGAHGGARFFSVSAASLEARRAAPASGGEPARTLVSCGHAWLDQEALIVDPETLTPCAARTVGEIWISGPSVAGGYWRRPVDSEPIFRARLAGDLSARTHLRTGDLGFIDGDDLFITGRSKDLIIIDGRNHYPQDLELTVEAAHPAIRENATAAFSVEIGSEERLVIVAELEREHMPGRRGAAPTADIQSAARRAVAEQHAVALHELVLIKTGYIPKTTSGKIQRRACAQGYVDGTLNRVDRA